MIKRVYLFAAIVSMLTIGGCTPVFAFNVAGKIIALDAGHGSSNTEIGASNVIDGRTIAEAEVNGTVLANLKAALESRGAFVVETERFSTRRERLTDAIDKCGDIDMNGDNIGDGRKCDIVVSIHHNGNVDADHDGTLAIYSQRADLPLAKAMLNSLASGMGLNNEGLLSGAYGMTVMKNLISTITEAYYVTNDCEAEAYYRHYINAAWIPSSSCSSNSTYSDGGILKNRVSQEVEAQLAGLESYFLGAGSGGGKPGKN